MRFPKHALLLIPVAAALLGGCGGGESTNPKELPPLDAADLKEIQERDKGIQDEETSNVIKK